MDPEGFEPPTPGFLSFIPEQKEPKSQRDFLLKGQCSNQAELWIHCFLCSIANVCKLFKSLFCDFYVLGTFPKGSFGNLFVKRFIYISYE